MKSRNTVETKGNLAGALVDIYFSEIIGGLIGKWNISRGK